MTGKCSILAVCLAAVTLVPGLGAQRLVPSRRWEPGRDRWPTHVHLRADSLQAGLAPEAGRRASRYHVLFRQVVGFRADSLLVEFAPVDTLAPVPVTDTLAIPARVVEYVDVGVYHPWRARLNTGGESAIYGALLGAVAGAIIGKSGRRGRSAATGAALGAGGTFVYGLVLPYHEYGVEWEKVTLRVVP